MYKIEKRKRQYRNILKQIPKLIFLYKELGVEPPSNLKGDIGEFICALEILKRYPKTEMEFKGRTYPDYDILIGDAKIQVKTQFGRKDYSNSKKWHCFYEGIPTINEQALKKHKFNVVFFVVIDYNNNFTGIKTKKIYIFDNKDFKHFSRKGALAGKNRKGLTIYKFEKPTGKLRKGSKYLKVIEYYNKRKYQNIFRNAYQNWDKIERSINK